MDKDLIIASGPVIIEGGMVLLDRHGKDEEAQSIWKFVGGKISEKDWRDEQNVLESACIRKVKEEMGIDIKIIAPLKPMVVKRPDSKEGSVVLIHYLSERIGEIKPAEDILEWQWFDIDRLPENCAPNIKPVIESYKKLVENKYKISISAVSELK